MKYDANGESPRELQVKRLTSFMVHKHYCENDVEALIALFDESFTWFGAAEQEYAVGTDVVAGIFRQFAGQVPKCNITDEQYDVISAGPDTYVCSGRLWITTDPSTNVYLRVHQRITTVFRFVKETARCCHIHISNPYSEMTDSDVGFPSKMARQSYEYLQEQIVAQKKQIEAQAAMLWRTSFEDSLTGLYNRNKYDEDLPLFQEGPGPLGIAFFDLNGLKEMNDRQGHHVGDRLLCQMAAHILRYFPQKAYRMGGDEVLVVDRESDEDGFRALVESVREAMRQDGISCSVGLSWRLCDCDVEAQRKEADHLMYLEKQQFYRLRENDRRGRRES